MLADANRPVELTAPQHQETTLSPLATAVLSIAGQAGHVDSRSVAKALEVGHALVIRECTVLAEEAGLLEICSQNPKTQRLEFCITDKGRKVLVSAAS